MLLLFSVELAITLVGCGSSQPAFTPVPIEGPSRIAWVMPGAEKDRKASIWWCHSDGVTTTCERTMLPLSGQREGCAMSTNSRVYVVTSPELFTKDISVTSCDSSSRDVQLDIERLVLEPTVNKRKFAAIGDTLYFASDAGLVALDVKNRKTTVLLHRELRKDFGVLRHENELFLSLPGGSLGRWTAESGLVVTQIDVKDIKPSRVWNNILVGLYVDPKIIKYSDGSERGVPPTPAYIALEESKRDLALTLAAKRSMYRGPSDVWIINDEPALVCISEVPSQFGFVTPSSMVLAHWGPKNVGYWSYGAELPLRD